MSDNRKLHAFYSSVQEHVGKQLFNNKEKYKKKVRYNTYLTEDGKEVITTEVSENETRINDHSKNFPDSQYLGIVTKWVQTVYWD